jgi:hypothetical protein
VLALRSLKAVPLTSFTSKQVTTALEKADLDGAESSTRSISDNGYVHVAPYLPSNLALFAKTQTIAIRRPVFDRLGPADRAAIRAAAAATVARADPAAQERSEVSRLCRQGLRLVAASAADLASLRRASASAYAALGRDAATGAQIRAIEQLKQDQPEAASSLPGCRRRNGSHRPAARFPQGRFSTMLTPGDFRRGGATMDPNFPVPFVVTIGRSRWHTNEDPQFGGRYVVHGDELTFIIDHPAENNGQSETLKWSYYRGELTFKIVDVADSGSRVIYTAHPWRRIG